jgi:hydroxyacylglutathione hydrolase
MEIFRLVFSPIRVNTYILADKSGDCAIIDCGCYDEGEFADFVDFIESKKLKPVLLLNTHSHLDHIFGNGFILKKWGLRAFSGEMDEFNRRQAPQHAMIFGLEMEESPEPAGFISDNQLFHFGSSELLALHVPGHAPGSFAFYSEKNGCVFTGDALFAGSIGRTDLQGGDYDTLMESIRTKLLTLPGSTVVYAGHGPETTIENEIKSNPFLT